MNNVQWVFVLNGTVAIVAFIVAVADLLQGGEMWPYLGVTIGLQVLALVWRE